jgi:hypothetical protein
MTKQATILKAALFLACASGAPALAQSEAEAARDVADQVRSQGNKCADPVQATRDPQESAPLLPVWILECADAKYKVRIVPDQGAEIDPIE